MQLSILIPTIPIREKQFLKLKHNLESQIAYCHKQHQTLGEVELVINDTVKFIDGGISVGMKRNRLVQSANGKYLCFLDDDDNISPDYVETLLRLCYQDKDVCTFRSLFKCDTYWSIIDMSLHAKGNEQATPDHIVKRKAWHICPVKSEYAQAYRFEDINNAEDWRWFEKVLSQVKTEAKSFKVIHQYNHSAISSAVDEIERV